MIYFLLYLFLEVLVSVSVSSAIGGFMTFIEILLSAFIGISILINFRNILMENLRAVSLTSITLSEFKSLNLFTLLGAFFLIIPGFLTDFVGILMQFSLLTAILSEKKPTYQEREESNIIDVDIIPEKEKELKHN